MRELHEIVEHIRTIKLDLFGTETNELVSRLPYGLAKEFLKPEVTEAEWTSLVLKHDNATIISEMEKYMGFAQGKALGHRGLSAMRSIDHYEGWLWLIEAEDILTENAYPMYGVPILNAICERFHFPKPIDEWDIKDWNRMARGLPCTPDCSEGCL